MKKTKNTNMQMVVSACKTLLPEIHRNRLRVLIGTGFVIISYLLIMAPPLFLSFAIDAFSAKQTTHTVLYTLYMLGSSALALVCVPAHKRYLADLEQRILAPLLNKWVEDILHTSFASLKNIKEGGLLNAFHRSWNAYETILRFALSTAIPACTEVLLITGYFVIQGALPLLGVLCVLAAIFVYIIHKTTHWRLPFVQKAMEVDDLIHTQQTEILKNAKSLKLAGSTSFASTYLQTPYKDYVQANTNYFFGNASLYSIKTGFAAISSAVILLVGVYMLQFNKLAISAGVFVVFYFYCNRLIQAVSTLVDGIQSLSDFTQSQKAITDILALPKERDDTHTPKSTKLTKITGLTLQPFKLPLEDGSLYLTNPSAITFSAKDSVAISGASGQGKTSLAELIARVHYQKRHVYLSDTHLKHIDYMDIGDLDEKTLRETVFLCDHKPSFLSGNLMQTLALPYKMDSKEPATDVEEPKMKYILQLLYLDSLIDFIDEKRDFPVKSLSTGEKKRLSLARAMLLNRPITILDEPTEALDDKLAQNIWRNLFEYFYDHLLICLTHDQIILPHFKKHIHIKNHTLHEITHK